MISGIVLGGLLSTKEMAMESKSFVEWDDNYSIGIPLVDNQHKGLVNITNKLFKGCLRGDEAARLYFLKTIHEAVDYAKYHFNTEEKIMERVNYPNYLAHKGQHQDFVRELVQEVQSFQADKRFVPNMMVRYLRDWVLSHIALSDKQLGSYIAELKKQGRLYTFTIKSRYEDRLAG
jgi:hemerythrin